MEKFGIFELLDALSALTARENASEEKSSAQDKVYLPPAYPAPEPPAEAQPTSKPQPPHPEKDALAGFYARHDAIAKKAGKK